MQKPKSFRPWQPDQTTLLPPSPPNRGNSKLMPEPDVRIARLADLQEQLAAIGQELQGLEPGSFEQIEVLERWAPIHAAVLALVDELEA
jgi:hypothetical protein